MLIRSQDKKSITNLDNIARITIEQISDSDYRIGAGYNYIGTYSTEEKTIKVLDMIQDAYREARIDEVYKEDGRIYRPVFRMPQEGEWLS